MTVSNTNNKGGPYNGNGSTTAFSTVFEFDNEGDLQVILTDSSGVETVQTITTDYTVSGGSGSAGTVTMVTAPASGEKLTILSDLSLTQGIDYTEGGEFPAETHEAGLDKLTRIAKQQQEIADRTLKVAASSIISGDIDTSGAAAGTAIVLNAAGTGFEFSSESVEDLADDAAAAAASATAAASSASAAATSAAAAAASEAALGSFAKRKLDATSAPTADNDGVDTAGLGTSFSVGSLWIDVTNDNSYVCVDASTGAAVWERTNNRDPQRYQREISYSDTVLSVTDELIYVFMEPVRLYNISVKTSTGTCDVTLNDSNTTDITFGGTPGATVSVTSTLTEHAVNHSSNAYYDFSRGDTLQLDISNISGAEDLIIGLDTVENYGE